MEEEKEGGKKERRGGEKERGKEERRGERKEGRKGEKGRKEDGWREVKKEIFRNLNASLEKRKPMLTQIIKRILSLVVRPPLALLSPHPLAPEEIGRSRTLDRLFLDLKASKTLVLVIPLRQKDKQLTSFSSRAFPTSTWWGKSNGSIRGCQFPTSTW